MSFRRNQFTQITKEVNISSRKNILEDLRDKQHDIQIALLQSTLNSFIAITSDQTSEIADLKLRLTVLESRYNSTFPTPS